MPNLFELKAERQESLNAAEQVIAKAESEKRALSSHEQAIFDQHMKRVTDLNPKIKEREDVNTITKVFPNMASLIDVGKPDPEGPDKPGAILPEQGKLMAKQLTTNFGAWARRQAGKMNGLDLGTNVPEMQAAAPSGVISIGTGSGLDSVGFAIPTQILPFLPSYFGFAPFEQAGSSLIYTEHMRPVNLPVLSAGAAPSSYAEGAGPAASPSGSTPMGLTGFSMGANKFSRQVIADLESLYSTEFPLQPAILDELLASVANVMTQAATTALYNALTAPPNFTIVGGVAPCQVGGSGVQADNYGQMMALRNSLVAGFENPEECAWMLSRNTLATIRNTRASTSGIVMFDSQSDTIFNRKYVINEYFDSVCGAGFVCYGNWKRGAWLRRTNIFSRILQELYILNSELGFLATQWGDNHFLAELVGAAQPPTWQPIWFTKLPTGSLP